MSDYRKVAVDHFAQAAQVDTSGLDPAHAAYARAAVDGLQPCRRAISAVRMAQQLRHNDPNYDVGGYLGTEIDAEVKVLEIGIQALRDLQAAARKDFGVADAPAAPERRSADRPPQAAPGAPAQGPGSVPTPAAK